MTDEQKDRIAKLCEGKEEIGWPDDVFFGGDSRETLKYSGWEDGRCLGWQLVRYGSEKREAQWDLAESHFIRWLEDRLLKAGCTITRYKNRTKVNDGKGRDWWNFDHLEVLFAVAEDVLR